MATPRPEKPTSEIVEEYNRLRSPFGAVLRSDKHPVFTIINDKGEELKGPKANFIVGERVVLKGRTYKVAYLNSEQLTLEPVSMLITREEEESE